MGKFKFMINVEPEDIPKLDISHKRDCADAVNGVINSVFKYTMFFTIGTMAYFGVYSIFGVTYLMRMNEVLPQIPLIMPLAALAAFIFEFIAGTMRKWAIVLEAALHAVMILSMAVHLQTLWLVPFAAYGIFIHFKLFTVIPVYKVISEQPGFPEFTPLPTKDEIKSAGSKKSETSETEDNTEKS